jgi:hypothetical protein
MTAIELLTQWIADEKAMGAEHAQHADSNYTNLPRPIPQAYPQNLWVSRQLLRKTAPPNPFHYYPSIIL